jgi:hypothetical protein
MNGYRRIGFGLVFGFFARNGNGGQGDGLCVCQKKIHQILKASHPSREEKCRQIGARGDETLNANLKH